MADIQFEDKAKIQEIIKESSRLTYLITQKYGIQLEEIIRLRVDGDNIKIDVHTTTEMLRFKAKGTRHALVKDLETGGMKMVLDPALAQAIYEIVYDYA